MCGSSSWWAKLALVCVLVALPLHIGGIASDNWMTYQSDQGGREVDVGLWRMKNCTSNDCQTSSVENAYVTGEFHAVRALETLAVVLLVVIAVMMLVYVCFRDSRVVSFAIAIVVIAFITGLCIAVGIVIWLATVPDPYVTSYSMGLTVLSSLLVLLTGSLMIPEIFDAEDPYRAPRSVSPYYSNGGYYSDRHTMVTPRSYRPWDGGPPSNGIAPISYRSGMYY